MHISFNKKDFMNFIVLTILSILFTQYQFPSQSYDINGASHWMQGYVPVQSPPQ